MRWAAAGQAFGFVFACLALSGLTADTLKPLFGRARPVVLDRMGFYGFHPFTFDAQWASMPSGHATTAFTLFGILAILLPRGRLLWLFAALAITVSRVMVNAHYLSDVLAGAVVGMGAVAALVGLGKNGIFPLLDRLFPLTDSDPPR